MRTAKLYIFVAITKKGQNGLKKLHKFIKSNKFWPILKKLIIEKKTCTF